MKLKQATPKVKARVLRDAARSVERGGYDRSCLALKDAAREAKIVEPESLGGPLREAYTQMLLDGKNATVSLPWDCDYNSPESMDIRVLLLGFAAAMAETGDLLTDNEATAARLLDVAKDFATREFEPGEVSEKPYTCNEIARRWEQDPVRIAYETLLLTYPDGASTESELWLDDDIGSLRVLLLCFAAAMAETGDLV